MKEGDSYTNQNGTCTKLYIEAKEDERIAKCSCGQQSKSDPKLPFFKQREEQMYDEYYCGCRGWG